MASTPPATHRARWRERGRVRVMGSGGSLFRCYCGGHHCCRRSGRLRGRWRGDQSLGPRAAIGGGDSSWETALCLDHETSQGARDPDHNDPGCTSRNLGTQGQEGTGLEPEDGENRCRSYTGGCGAGLCGLPGQQDHRRGGRDRSRSLSGARWPAPGPPVAPRLQRSGP